MLLRLDPSVSQDDLRASDAVFAGEVLNVGEAPSVMIGGPEPSVPVGFAVEGAWKGVDAREVVVMGEDGASCGFDFREGESCLVYADRGEAEGDEVVGAGLCGPTKPLAATRQELGVLGPPLDTPPDAGELVPTGGLPTYGAAKLLLVVPVGVAVVVFSGGRARA